MTTIHLTSTDRRSFRDGPSRRSGKSVLVTFTVLVSLLAGGATMATAAPSAPPASAGGYSAQALGTEAAGDLAAGRTGRAILEYERARILAPRAPALEAGLKQARAVAGLPEEAPRPVLRALHLLSANEWSRIGALAAGLASAAFVALAWGARRRWLIVTTLAGVAACGLALGAAAAITAPSDQAVVVAADAVIRIAPFPQAEPQFAEPEGTTVTVQRTHGGFALVHDARGSGWLPLDKLERLFPASAMGRAAPPRS